MVVSSNETFTVCSLRRNQTVAIMVIRPHAEDPFWLAAEVACRRDHITVQWWEEAERGIYRLGGMDSVHAGSVMGVVHTQSVQKGRMVLTWKMRAKITGIVMADQRTRPPKKQLRVLTGNKVHSPRAVVAPAVKTASERIREAAGQRRSTLSTYKTYFNLFKSVCCSHALDPWVYSVDTALKFMAYMLERETHGRVCHDIRPYFTAANHFYEKKGLGRPWAAKRIRQLNIGYQRARSATSKAEGRPAPRSRVTVPHMMIERICKDHEQDEDAWRAIFLIMLMTGLRADSAGALRPENVRFVDGSLVVDVLRCKTDDEPRTKVIRAPQRRDHFRHRAFAIINM
eukprot:COSAG06_NODE_2628_length_6556_cov_4.840948_1_plen_342_part_00